MDTGAFGIRQVEREIDCSDFNEVLNASIPNLEYVDHSEVCEDISTDEDMEQIKNENEIDIVYEDIKRGIGEVKSNELDRFCEVCYETFGSSETDFIKSKSAQFECSCQNQNDVINIQGRDMTLDVKPLILTTEIGVQDESQSVDECGYVQVSSLTPRREISVSLLKNGKKVTPTKIPADLLFPNRKSHSISVENDLFGKRQNTDEIEKTFQCEICTKSFTNVVSLRIHDKKVHRRNDPHRCKYCKKCFEKRSGLVVHERIHTGEKPFHCKTCSKSFSNSSILKYHEKIHSGEKAFKCKICSKNFRTASHLRIHDRIHTGEKPFLCKICSKCFASHNYLKVHEMIHTGEKPFNCKICSRSFRTSDRLKKHEKIHEEERLFHCNICSKAYVHLCDLKVHERLHTGEKLSHCKICSKVFTNPSRLKTHEMTHTREKPFHCKTCAKSFSNPSDLKVHERIHTGEKPFHCKTCSKSFGSNSNLRVHEKYHRNERPFVCEICSKSFKVAHCLKRHNQRYHTEEKSLVLYVRLERIQAQM